MMKLKAKFEKLLSNKTLLNVIFVISFLNIIGFVILNKTIAIVYFILIGLITSVFSNNMIIILAIPLILVNLFIANSNNWSFNMSGNNREGLENNGDNKNMKKDGSKQNKTDSSKNPATSTSSSTTTSSQGLPMTMTPLDHSNSNNNNNNTNTNNNSDSNEDSNVDESFEVGRSRKNAKGYNIDYASTIEDAYDELNKILGSDGVKRLTSDTQNLMKQQMQLAESMKSMQPLIAGMAPLMQQAQGLLGSMGDNGNLGNLADIAKKFSTSLGKQ